MKKSSEVSPLQTHTQKLFHIKIKFSKSSFSSISVQASFFPSNIFCVYNIIKKTTTVISCFASGNVLKLRLQSHFSLTPFPALEKNLYYTRCPSRSCLPCTLTHTETMVPKAGKNEKKNKQTKTSSQGKHQCSWVNDLNSKLSTHSFIQLNWTKSEKGKKKERK